MSTMFQILDTNNTASVFVPPTNGARSCVYISIGSKTVRASSRAILESRLNAPVYALAENEPYIENFKYTFRSGLAKTAIIAILIEFIGGKQGIRTDRRSNTSSCTTTR